ncbi:MAG: alpha/beta hydrolase [Gemmatimonadales bacterium]|nr:alpha/beta hydrolase [Gemmatimonadales bacterium]
MAPAAPAVERLRAVAVNGTTLHFRVLGDTGTPVVFVHGSLDNLGTWSAQDTAFARTYRVLVYSRRYHPPNPQVADGQVYSPKLHAEDLAALLLRLELAPAHVVGSSYGAYTALALARDHPSLVRSLVLAEPPIASLLSGTTGGDSVRYAVFANSLDPARAAFARGDSIAGLRAFVDGVLGRVGAYDALPPAARAHLARHAFEMRLEMLANREQYLPPVSCADLGRLSVPVLIVRGQRSGPFFQLISDELARCLRNDSTVSIPGAAHGMHAENPRYFNAILRRYLAGR